jgi:isoleucyl-tRNA synthetase
MHSPDTPAEPYPPLPEDIKEDPAAAELAVLELWRVEDVFAALQRARAGAAPFVFWEGPPTANGRPGIHHVLARTIKDAVCRYRTMLGLRVERKAGWDTHGLPVELEVEKALGISGKPEIEKHGVAAFNARCRESVWTYRKDWEELSARIGYWLDYADPYVTYDEDYVESVWSLLKLFHERGLVYRGNRVLPYCGRCGTGLSSHELGQPGVYRDVKDPSVILRFRRVDPPSGEPESLLAWTTTPWTLPSNFALAVHPGKDYVLARVARGEGSELVWLAEARAEAVLGEHEVLERRKGAEFVGWTYEPLFRHPRLEEVRSARRAADAAGLDRVHKVYGADFVTIEDGTGIVHQAPYGVDDWSLAQAHAIPTGWFLGVGRDGRFQLDVGPVRRGTFFKDADDALMDDLKRRGLLFRKAREDHSYPHCWRCDTPLFYFPAPAWYIRTTGYKDRMVALNRRIRWVPPEVGEKRFGEWLENNVDWNISRDRYWGTPLPFWVCDGGGGRRPCGAVVAIGSVAELRERAGALPEGFDNHKPLIDEVVFPCEGCGGTMRRTPSVLDCWFDSGAMPYAQYHWPFGGGKAKVQDQFPADFIAEGLDQTRGWFYTLHAIGSFMTDPATGTGLPDGPAYRTCVVNGLVLDKDGVKMSKRLGNVVDPWQAVREHGADAVRWYLLSSGSPWLPKRFDEKGLEEVRRRFPGKLIDSYGFLALYAGLADGYRPGRDVAPPPADRPEIDRWLVSRTQTTVQAYRERMDEYDLAGACRLIERFVVDELSNWYIRRNRRRFWKAGRGSDKNSAFATLHAALRTVALLAAPLAPFIAELVWRRLGGEGSVHAALLPEPDLGLQDEPLEASMQDVARVVEMGHALRNRSGLKVRQPLAALHVRSSDARALELLGTPFATELVLDELNVKSWGSLRADDGHLCTLRAKPNFRVLGKRLGGRMKAAAELIEGLSQAAIARIRSGEAVELDLPGGIERVGPDDVQVSVETDAAFDVETDGRFVVYLETELTPELVAEGWAREVVNRVNGLRKERGLAVDDRIRLVLGAQGRADLERALQEHGEMIRNETLAAELVVADEAQDAGPAERFDLGSGLALSVRLAPI